MLQCVGQGVHPPLAHRGYANVVVDCRPENIAAVLRQIARLQRQNEICPPKCLPRLGRMCGREPRISAAPEMEELEAREIMQSIAKCQKCTYDNRTDDTPARAGVGPGEAARDSRKDIGAAGVVAKTSRTSRVVSRRGRFSRISRSRLSRRCRLRNRRSNKVDRRSRVLAGTGKKEEILSAKDQSTAAPAGQQHRPAAQRPAQREAEGPTNFCRSHGS